MDGHSEWPNGWTNRWPCESGYTLGPPRVAWALWVAERLGIYLTPCVAWHWGYRLVWKLVYGYSMVCWKANPPILGVQSTDPKWHGHSECPCHMGGSNKWVLSGGGGAHHPQTPQMAWALRVAVPFRVCDFNPWNWRAGWEIMCTIWEMCFVGIVFFILTWSVFHVMCLSCNAIAKVGPAKRYDLQWWSCTCGKLGCEETLP